MYNSERNRAGDSTGEFSDKNDDSELFGSKSFIQLISFQLVGSFSTEKRKAQASFKATPSPVKLQPLLGRNVR